MELIVPLIALVGILFIVGRRVPLGGWFYAVLLAAILVVSVVTMERAGLWPDAWRR